MSFTSKKWSLNKILVPGAAAGCLAVAVLLGLGEDTAKASKVEKQVASAAPAAVFPANAGTLGAIPDLPTGCQPSVGPPLDVTFTVSGVTGTLSDIQVSFTGTHTWMGDVIATLKAPGGTPSQTIFGRTLATTATGSGDSSDLGGPYVFSDSASSPPSGGWWQAATAAGATTALTAGTYRTTASGGAGATNPMPPTSLNSTFGGIDPNGTWTLTFTDGCAQDTGTVTAASLTIEGGTSTPANTMHDYDGDGKSDHVVVRNVGGGQDGQVRWFINNSSNGSISAHDWGLASDFFVGGDFDGDGKTDVVIWRPGSSAEFLILNSSDSTVTTDTFGQNGDDPTVVGDYDGDGKADVAIYRAGGSGQQSLWCYRGSLNNPSGNIAVIPWGMGGDFPAPGDYDGDGKHDFVVQRPGAANVFWRLFSTGPIDAIQFGNSTDMIVPGDYDGDGKTDIAVAHVTGGNYQWWYFSSLNNAGLYAATFGLDTDVLLAGGDYDGDGRADYGVWRDGVFFYQSSSTGALMVNYWGIPGDYPVSNYPVH